MNFIIRNLLLFTVLLCTVACSLDENFDRSSWKNIDFRVSVSGQSRVAIQKDGSGDFQAGDELALRVYESQPDKLQDKTLLHSEGNRWTSSIYWKDWEETPHFYAVWPSVTQIELWEGTCWYVHRVNRDQSVEKDFLSSDLLVADAEGQSVIAHEAVGDFLRGGPVGVELFERPVGIDAKAVQDLEEALHHALCGREHARIHGDALGVDHARHEIVGAKHDAREFAHDVRRVGAAVVEEPRIALLRHGGRHVGVLASFRKQDPGARLRILHHDVGNEGSDVERRRRGDLSEFDREVDGGFAGRVEGVRDGGREAERLGHLCAVQGPARAVQDRGAHGRTVVAREALIEAFALAQEGVDEAQEIVTVAVGLRGDAVRVDRVAVGFGKSDQLFKHGVEGVRKDERFVAVDRHAHGREHVLARAARVNEGHFGTRRLDEKGFIGDVGLHALGGVGRGRFLHGADAAGGEPCRVVPDQSLGAVHDDRRLVDGGKPEKFIALHGDSPLLWVGCVFRTDRSGFVMGKSFDRRGLAPQVRMTQNLFARRAN